MLSEKNATLEFRGKIAGKKISVHRRVKNEKINKNWHVVGQFFLSLIRFFFSIKHTISIRTMYNVPVYDGIV